jgi:ribonuclease P protein component
MQHNDTQQKQKFSKIERLCSRSKIKALFEKSNSINAYPIKLLWKQEAQTVKQPALQLVISVPKRNIKKAVMRNKIKRRIREAYRRNKYLLMPSEPTKSIKCSAIFIFTGKEEISYKEAEIKIIQLLNRLILEYEKAAR